jgi:hypothetical protein
VHAASEYSRLSREEIMIAVRMAPVIAKPAPTRKAVSKPLVSATVTLVERASAAGLPVLSPGTASHQ